MSRTCGYCGKRSYGEFCVQHKPRKPIPKQGKQAKKWLSTRKQWLKDNPPNYQGLWRCELHISPQCLAWVDSSQLHVDHVISRSKRPDLRYDQSNLQASCSPCNLLKGSRLLQ